MKYKIKTKKCSNCGKDIGHSMPRPIPPDYLCDECTPLFYSPSDYLNDIFPTAEA